MGIPHRYPMIIQSSILGSLHPQLHPEMNGIPSDGDLPGKKFIFFLIQKYLLLSICHPPSCTMTLTNIIKECDHI